MMPAILGGTPMSLASPTERKPVTPVWPEVPPGSEAWTPKEVESLNPQTGEKRFRNVVMPPPAAHLPHRAEAAATGVVVYPGGGFVFLAWDSAGAEAVQWLAPHGTAAFVLKYRLIPPPRPHPISIRQRPRSSRASLLALLVWSAHNTVDKHLRRFKFDRRHRVDLLHQRRQR